MERFGLDLILFLFRCQIEFLIFIMGVGRVALFNGLIFHSEDKMTVYIITFWFSYTILVTIIPLI